MQGVRCFHSPADYSFAQFPSDHWRFFPGLPVEIVLHGLKEVQKHFGILEKLRTFFEKPRHFNVKFRKFFGYFFLENVKIKSNQASWTSAGSYPFANWMQMLCHE
jgi:hypothetical protein